MERHHVSQPDLSYAQAPWALVPCQRALVAEHALWIGNQAARPPWLPRLPHVLHVIWIRITCSALSLLADQFQGHKVGIPVGLYAVLAMSSRLVGVLRAWRHCKVPDGTAEQWKHYLDLCGCHGKSNCLQKIIKNGGHTAYIYLYNPTYACTIYYNIQYY